MEMDKAEELVTDSSLPLDLTEVHPMEISESIENSKNDNKQFVDEIQNLTKTNGPRQRKKRKKSKKIVRAKDYPKYFQNAYVRYCNESRPKVAKEHPQLDPVEITKLVANMWYNLTNEEKQPYLQQAKIDKERFKRELKEFQRLNPNSLDGRAETTVSNSSLKIDERRDFQSSGGGLKLTSKTKKKSISKESLVNLPSTSSSSAFLTTSENYKRNDEIPKVLNFNGINCEVPIFTDIFLEHNKTIESELKILRKNNIEMEQQNSVLMKHIENMENGVHKVEAEINQFKSKNLVLEVYITKLRCLLAANFHSLFLPNTKVGATVENIDNYLQELSKSSNTAIILKARDILKNIELKISS